MRRFSAFIMMICATLLGSIPSRSTYAQAESLLYLRVASKGYIAMNAETGQVKFNLPVLADKLVAFSPNRSHFYSIEDTQITVYESHTGQISKTIVLDQPISKDIPYCNNPRTMGYISSDEHWYYNVYAYGCNDVREDILRVVDLAQGKVIPAWIDLKDFCGVHDEINNVVLFGCGHGFFNLDLATRQLTSALIAFSAYGPNTQWSWVSVSNQLAYIWKDDSKLSVWDTKTAHALWQIEVPPSNTDSRRMWITQDRSKLIFSAEDFYEQEPVNGTKFRILNASDGNRIAAFEVEYKFLDSDMSWNGRVFYGLVRTHSGVNPGSDTFVAIDTLTGQTIYQVNRSGEKLQRITFVP